MLQGQGFLNDFVGGVETRPGGADMYQGPSLTAVAFHKNGKAVSGTEVTESGPQAGRENPVTINEVGWFAPDYYPDDLPYGRVKL